MAQVRTWCEWKLEQLKRYQTILPQRRSFTPTDFRIREATGLPTLPQPLPDSVLQQITPETPTQLLIVKLMFLTDRQLFNTAKGYLGLVIKGAKSGDLVCDFNTATTPHVLRKVKGEEEVYEVVGDAYVSDLMYCQVDGLGIEERDIVLV
jgi:hypothetical protein